MKSKTFSVVYRISVPLLLTLALTLMSRCSDSGEKKEPDESRNLTVSFDLGYTGAQNVPGPFTVTSGGTPGGKFPQDPVREGGYTFEGWYTSAGAEFTAETVVTRDITVIARWEQDPPEEADLFADITLTEPYKTYGDHNPVMTQRFGADPWALVYEDRVYLYMTGDTFRYSGGNLIENDYSNINTIRLLSSSDLVNWTEHPEVRASGAGGLTNGGSTNSWAPAAAWKNIDGQDKFFLYFADNANGIFVLSADSPVGPFTAPLGNRALINRSTPNCSSVTWLFDPAILMDDDGRAYIYFGGGVPNRGSLDNFDTAHPMPGTERVVQLGDDMISIVGTPQSLNAPFIYEDAGINKIGDTYYFSYCSNTQVHHYATRPDDFPAAAKIGKSGAIVYMTGQSPLGPFTLQDMILPNPDENLHLVDGVRHGAGANNHHAVFEFRGKFYIAYHSRILEMAMGVPSSIPREGYRITHIDEIPLNSDGSFKPITGTREGVKQEGYFNPYETVDGATFGCMAGLMTAVIDPSDPGCTRMKATDIDTGDRIAVYGVNFGARGAKRFTCRVNSSAGGEGGVIQIRQDSTDGKPVGYVNVEAGKSGNITVDLLKTVTGIHDLVFVFYGSGYEFEEWRFAN